MPRFGNAKTTLEAKYEISQFAQAARDGAGIIRPVAKQHLDHRGSAAAGQAERLGESEVSRATWHPNSLGKLLHGPAQDSARDAGQRTGALAQVAR